MSWQIGFDEFWNRDIGYGVPSMCDKPGCEAFINRGLSYVCGGEVRGGEAGCGLYFCDNHLSYSSKGKPLCPRCLAYKPPYKKPKDDVEEWVAHKLHDPSWQKWREENPVAVEELERLWNDAN